MSGEFRSSYAWKKKRKEIKALYGGKCAICGSTENCQTHHIVPMAVVPELKLDNDNLILLCNKCHELAHNAILSQTKLKSMIKHRDAD